MDSFWPSFIMNIMKLLLFLICPLALSTFANTNVAEQINADLLLLELADEDKQAIAEISGSPLPSSDRDSSEAEAVRNHHKYSTEEAKVNLMTGWDEGGDGSNPKVAEDDDSRSKTDEMEEFMAQMDREQPPVPEQTAATAGEEGQHEDSGQVITGSAPLYQ